MKNIIRVIFSVLFAALLLFALSGCMSKSAEDLYSLPQLSAGSLQLQSEIDAVLSSGAVYSAPTSGSYRQPVQLEDLDGDGIKEVLAFFSIPGSSKPQKIYIFRYAENGYEQAAIIEGGGNSIGSVNYIDMDGDGVKEMTVGWQMAAGINLLSVYSLRDFNISALISTDYSQYITGDTLGDGHMSVTVLRMPSSEAPGEAETYSMSDDGEIVSSTAYLSSGIEAFTRVRSGLLAGGYPAVYVESSVTDGSLVTDILAFRGDRLCNITLDETCGVSTDTLRSYGSYCRDIDGDGVLDVPKPIPLPSQSESSYYSIEWRTYSPDGTSEVACTTYSNYFDSWYLILPEGWSGHLAVRRDDSVAGERAVVFSAVDESSETPLRDFLVIYTLSGENRYERSISGNRFTVLSDDSTIYAAEILSDTPMKGITVSEDLIKSSFNIIYSEWKTGET